MAVLTPVFAAVVHKCRGGQLGTSIAHTLKVSESPPARHCVFVCHSDAQVRGMQACELVMAGRCI